MGEGERESTVQKRQQGLKTAVRKRVEMFCNNTTVGAAAFDPRRLSEDQEPQLLQQAFLHAMET
eukprot:1344717-Prorocentrum_lima.AAC.1